MKRGKPLRRKAGMPARTKWMPRKRKTQRRSERKRDPVHLANVHSLALGCWAFVSIPGHRCKGWRELDHAARRPMGRKCDDVDIVVLCRTAHGDRTAWRGEFKSWDQARMRAWLLAGTAWTSALIAAQKAVAKAQDDRDVAYSQHPLTDTRELILAADESRARAIDLIAAVDALRPRSEGWAPP